MPTVKRFSRSRITMYFKDHQPPHFHVITNDDETVLVAIETTVIIKGEADSRDIEEALVWARANVGELQRLWREYSGE